MTFWNDHHHNMKTTHHQHSGIHSHYNSNRQTHSVVRSHSHYCTMKSFFLFTALLCWNAVAALPDPPIVEDEARVKQHRSGAQGDLVAGEEHLLKAIIYWNPVRGAKIYEVCLGCSIQDGERLSEEQGRIETSEPGDTCGGRQCLVMPGTPRGINSYNVRVQTDEGWSKWSEHANFLVDDSTIGMAPHIPHEEL